VKQFCRATGDKKRRDGWALTSTLQNTGAMPTARRRLGAVPLTAWGVSLAGAGFVGLCEAACLLQFADRVYSDRDPASLTGR
jgi:hypothetical protein